MVVTLTIPVWVMDQLGVVGVGVSGGIGREMLAKVTTMPLMHSGRTIR